MPPCREASVSTDKEGTDGRGAARSAASTWQGRQEIKQKRLIGDIALGVGVACIGAAAYLWLAPGKKAPPKEAAALDVRVGPNGAWAGYGGTF
jgi:hypothetical protein